MCDSCGEGLVAEERGWCGRAVMYHSKGWANITTCYESRWGVPYFVTQVLSGLLHFLHLPLYAFSII